MPFYQASHLAALPVYLELLGVSDISQLAPETGAPPIDDPQLFVGCLLMDLTFLDVNLDKASSELRIDSSYELFPLPTICETLPTFDILCEMPNDGTIIPLNQIDVQYVDFNARHQVLRRQDRETFVFIDPTTHLETVITAKQIQLFINHNYRMNDPSLDVTQNPIGYTKFADDMNDCDGHEAKWACWREAVGAEPSWMEWRPDGALPSLVDFIVRDSDMERPVPDHMILVERERYERATESMWRQVQGRERSIATSRVQRANRETRTSATSEKSRAIIAARTAATQAAYEDRAKAAHKAAEASKAAAAVTGNSGGPAPMDQDQAQ
ncbi:hypothetical protein C8J57DRAFT_1511290 [Mycena rebaudengoi]|nr:hypothetical protein C8J57DRAFT_1511290 [Mycena rebaudengoi]